MNEAFFRCICNSADRLMARRLKDEGYEVINLQKQRDRRAEAYAYKMKLPFIIKDGKAEQL